MNKRIKLTCDWENDGTKYAKGQVLEVDSATADELIAANKAALQPEDTSGTTSDAETKVVDGNQPETKSYSEQDIQRIVDAAVSKAARTPSNSRPPIRVVREQIDDDKKCGYRHKGEYMKHICLHGTNRISFEDNKKLALSDRVAKSMEQKALGSDELATLEGGLGGFLIPPEFRQELLTAMILPDIVRPRCMYVPVTGMQMMMPVQIDTTHAAGAVHGGVQVYRVHERTQGTAAKPTFEQIELNMKKLMGLCYITDEMMSSAPTLNAMIGPMFQNGFAFKEMNEWLHGNGAGNALGILNAPATITVTKESGQAAATILLDNVRKMRQRCFGYDNAVWIANYDTYSQLSSLNQTIGVAGQLVWHDKATLDVPDLLLGRPIFFHEQARALGTAGDLILANFAWYALGERGESKFDVSIHVRFDSAEHALRFMKWNDGQPTWRSALTPRYSTETLSPFVVLETRS